MFFPQKRLVPVNAVADTKLVSKDGVGSKKTITPKAYFPERATAPTLSFGTSFLVPHLFVKAYTWKSTCRAHQKICSWPSSTEAMHRA